MHKNGTFFWPFLYSSGFYSCHFNDFSNGIENGVTHSVLKAMPPISIRAGITTKKDIKDSTLAVGYNCLAGDYDNLKQKAAISNIKPCYSAWGGQVNYKTQQGNYRIEKTNADQQFVKTKIWFR
jgi:putative ABC transport system permease protein